MASSGRITYTPRPETTPETERSALAEVYRFVVDARLKREAARPRQAGDLEEAKEIEDVRPNASILG